MVFIQSMLKHLIEKYLEVRIFLHFLEVPLPDKEPFAFGVSPDDVVASPAIVALKESDNTALFS